MLMARVARKLLAIGCTPLAVLTAMMWVRSSFVIDGIEWTWWRGPDESTERSFLVAAAAGVSEINFRSSTQYDAAGRPMAYSSSAHAAVVRGGHSGRVVYRVVHLEPIEARLHTYYRQRPPRYRPNLETVQQALPLAVAPPVTGPGQVWRGHGILLTIPLWLLAVGLSIPPGMAVFHLVRRRHRAAAGRCILCGYDLRANLTGVCPECGGIASCTGERSARP
jgi:hypothetical protein